MSWKNEAPLLCILMSSFSFYSNRNAQNIKDASVILDEFNFSYLKTIFLDIYYKDQSWIRGIIKNI